VTRVLFVSKPISPPFHDGTKCLVRDVATHLKTVSSVVLTSAGPSPALTGLAPIESVPVYSDAGAFTPAFAQNLRAAAWILLRSRADVWHFVFAPNLRTSQAGRWLKSLRRLPVVQTIASPPRSFHGIERLLFGDHVVAQSRWTRDRVLSVYAESGQVRPFQISVIPPPVSDRLERSPESRQRARAELEIANDSNVFIYPGDLETSRGAETAAALSLELRARIPNAVLVIAYRRKTERAEGIARQLAARLDPRSTRLVSEVSDLLGLIASAAAVLFPVDDLCGKVDLPIVLLEAMVLGVPVVALGAGPLADLAGAELIPTLDLRAWLESLERVSSDPAARAACIERQHQAVAEHYAAPRVAAAYEALYVRLDAAR
jgi:glycosyltransferase involved in cell wall biosynthesis